MSVSLPNGLTYVPGATQHLVVTVADPVQVAWGFELTARQSNIASAQAGTFTPGGDGYTQIVCTQTTFQSENWGSCDSSMPLQYIEQTYSGVSYGQTGHATFEFDWAPPATNVGNITIYVAGLAADGDGSQLGDNTYLQTYVLTPVQANQPAISSGGVVNAATFQPGIAAGSWVTIAGTNLANSTRSWRASDFAGSQLPTHLDGVSLEIDGKPAYVSYISPTQINALAPADASLGPINVVVNNNGAPSAPATALLQSVSPAFFVWSGKYAVATRADFSLIGPTTLFPGKTAPVKPGDVAILWGTGFGPTNPPAPVGQETSAGQIYTVANSVSVTIGNVAAHLVGKALSPGAAGLYQIAVEIPGSLADGDQPVWVQAGGYASPAGIYITVQH